MAGPSALLAAVLAFFAIERGVEIVVNRRNAKRLREAGAVWVERDGFGLIVAAQVLLFLGTAAEATVAAWGGPKPWTVPLLVALALAQALRYWCITTLGWRWSVRVVTVPGAPRVTNGPYRFFAHPNYAVVLIEVVLLPLAFGAYATLLVAALLQLIALQRRIALEERALGGTLSPLAPAR